MKGLPPPPPPTPHTYRWPRRTETLTKALRGTRTLETPAEGPRWLGRTCSTTRTRLVTCAEGLSWRSRTSGRDSSISLWSPAPSSAVQRLNSSRTPAGRDLNAYMNTKAHRRALGGPALPSHPNVAPIHIYPNPSAHLPARTAPDRTALHLTPSTPSSSHPIPSWQNPLNPRSTPPQRTRLHPIPCSPAQPRPTHPLASHHMRCHPQSHPTLAHPFSFRPASPHPAAARALPWHAMPSPPSPSNTIPQDYCSPLQ